MRTVRIQTENLKVLLPKGQHKLVSTACMLALGGREQTTDATGQHLCREGAPEDVELRTDSDQGSDVGKAAGSTQEGCGWFQEGGGGRDRKEGRGRARGRVGARGKGT